jgi:3-isopropylmalate/(R)-2-methylmalate dehydratase small subunit
LFAPWRYLSPGSRDPDPAFVLNQPRYADAHILLGGDNFGCGSSREHAVWALAEYGIRAIIAPSFAPIFAGNCIRNGVLPVVLDRASVAANAAANEPVTIDLAQQQVEMGSQRWTFAIGAEAKAMLLEGLDGIELTLKHRERIAAFQRADRLARPWIYFSTQP